MSEYLDSIGVTLFLVGILLTVQLSAFSVSNTNLCHSLFYLDSPCMTLPLVCHQPAKLHRINARFTFSANLQWIHCVTDGDNDDGCFQHQWLHPQLPASPTLQVLPPAPPPSPPSPPSSPPLPPWWSPLASCPRCFLCWTRRGREQLLKTAGLHCIHLDLSIVSSDRSS